MAEKILLEKGGFPCGKADKADTEKTIHEIEAPSGAALLGGLNAILKSDPSNFQHRKAHYYGSCQLICCLFTRRLGQAARHRMETKNVSIPTCLIKNKKTTSR